MNSSEAPAPTPPYQLHAELTLMLGGDLLANAKRIELLRQIGLTGNLTKAAKIAGYSYKGAWDTIDQMTRLTGGSLLERHAGGKGGGRTRLTERGKQLLRNFALLQGEHARFIDRLNRIANGLDADYAVQPTIAMKTSARNQFGGIILSMLQGPVNDEVVIMVDGSLMLTASITHESCRELALDIGAKVYALIKASAIALHQADEIDGEGRRNLFPCTVNAVKTGGTHSEVTLVLEGGASLVCTVSNDMVSRMNLRPASTALCEIEPSSIILAVAT